MKITVKLANGQEQTQVFSQPVVTIGRSNKSDFVVLDESLSRQHCQVEYSNGDFFVTDLGSSNGVFLDGVRVTPSTRTPFTTFLQLHVGSLECLVSDDDAGMPQASHSAPSKPQSSVNEPTSATKVSKSTPPKPMGKATSASKNDKKNEKKNSLPLTVIAVIILAAGAWYQFSGEEEVPAAAKSLEVIQVEKNVPVALRTIKDEFYSLAEYEVNESEKNCTTFAEFCKEMDLSTEAGEGITQKTNEFFVYIIPSLHLKHPLIRPVALDKFDFNDSVALFTLLNSKLAEDFSNKKIGQIHLIIKNAELKSVRVFRFHVKNYASNERSRLLSELVPVMGSGESKDFWVYAKPLIKVLEF